MHFIVYDLEATCWQNRPPSIPQETIEFGAFKLTEDGEAVRSFQAFVRPILHPRLSSFCTELTGIEQADVDRADRFDVVCDDFIEFCGYDDGEDYLLCSWGDFDAKQLRRDCRLHRMGEAWIDPHVNLKRQYKEIKRLSKPRGLARAVAATGQAWEGPQHRAIDDARNLVKVFRAYIDEWVY